MTPVAATKLVYVPALAPQLLPPSSVEEIDHEFPTPIKSSGTQLYPHHDDTAPPPPQNMAPPLDDTAPLPLSLEDDVTLLPP